MFILRAWKQVSLLTVLCLLGSVASSQIYDSERYDFLLQTVTNGLERPLALVFLSSEEILIAEQAGKLRWLVDGDLKESAVSGLPEDFLDGEDHTYPVLLDLIRHADFDDQPWLYFSYLAASDDNDGTFIKVARGQFDNGAISMLEELFSTEVVNTREHVGGQLVMNSSNHLLMTLGDQGEPAMAMDTLSHAGSVIRLTDNGEIPEDNPWVGTDEGLDELYSWGHRHGIGFAIDPDTDQLWQVDQRSETEADRLQRIRAGRHYGWPEALVENHGCCGKRAESIDNQPQPWLEDAVASSLTFYQGDSFSEWSGSAFLSTVSGQRMLRLLPSDEGLVLQEPLVQEFNTPVRNVITGADGTLWILTDEDDARLMRFVR